jgi:RNA polymerase subunit RPABC4/transcription elongation factor Spt4
MEPFIDFDSLGEVFVYLSAFFGAFLAAFWLSLIFWTYRDIRSRTRDRIIHVLASALVTLLNLPGLLIYLILRPKATLVEAYQRTLEEEALLTEIETRRVCPGCGSTIDQDWQICAYCHTRIQKVCTTCGRLLELPWQICPYCATPIPGSPHTVIEIEEEPSLDDSVEMEEPSLSEETESELIEDPS